MTDFTRLLSDGFYLGSLQHELSQAPKETVARELRALLNAAIEADARWPTCKIGRLAVALYLLDHPRGMTHSQFLHPRVKRPKPGEAVKPSRIRFLNTPGRGR